MSDKPQNLQDVSAAAFGPGGELDLFQDMNLSPAKRAAWIVAIGFVVLALFNAQGFVKWAQGLPTGAGGDWRTRVADTVLEAAERWQGATQRLGTADLFEIVRRAFREFRGA